MLPFTPGRGLGGCPMRRAGRTRVQALTLLEVVVALSLLVVLFLGLATSLTSGMSVDALTRERVAATLRATSVMEAVVSAPWSDLPAKDATTFDVVLEAEGGSYSLP